MLAKSMKEDLVNLDLLDNMYYEYATDSLLDS